jgi:hypothetical protein
MSQPSTVCESNLTIRAKSLILARRGGTIYNNSCDFAGLRTTLEMFVSVQGCLWTFDELSLTVLTSWEES